MSFTGRRNNLQPTTYRRDRLSIWPSEALGVGSLDGHPALTRPARLPMALGGHRPALSWRSLPAGTAPTGHWKPTLFRNKGAVCTTHGPMEPAWHGHGKSPGGKSTKAITGCEGGLCWPRGPGDRPQLQRGPGTTAPGTGTRRGGENARNVAASRNAPSYRGWCSLMWVTSVAWHDFQGWVVKIA